MDRETALRELNAGNPDLQRLAARVLGQWTDDKVLGALIGALKSPHRGIREAATDTLIEIGDARALRLLVPLLKSSVPAVRNAARVLMQRLAKAAPEILTDLSGDPDARMRIFAANIMGDTGDHEMVPPLLDLLDDADENVRDAAVVSLGLLGAPEAVHRLEQTASQGISWTRFSAIDALSQIRSPEAVRALLRLLQGCSPEIQEPVVDALGRQRSVETISALVEKLRGPSPLRPVLVLALAGLPPEEVVARSSPSDRGFLATALVETLGENGLGPDVSVAVLELLGKLGVPIDGGIFVRLLSSSQRRVRQAAVRAAARLRLPETLPLLRQLASQADPLLADEIKAALAVFAEPGKERM